MKLTTMIFFKTSVALLSFIKDVFELIGAWASSNMMSCNTVLTIALIIATVLIALPNVDQNSITRHLHLINASPKKLHMILKVFLQKRKDEGT